MAQQQQQFLPGVFGEINTTTNTTTTTNTDEVEPHGSIASAVGEWATTTAPADMALFASLSLPPVDCSSTSGEQSSQTAQVSRSRARGAITKPTARTGKHRCDTCDHTTDRKTDLARHKKTHGGEAYKCPCCENLSSQMDHYKTHFRTKHMGEEGKVFKTLCGQLAFSDTTQASRHYKECSSCKQSSPAGGKKYTGSACDAQVPLPQSGAFKVPVAKKTATPPQEPQLLDPGLIQLQHATAGMETWADSWNQKGQQVPQQDWIDFVSASEGELAGCNTAQL